MAGRRDPQVGGKKQSTGYKINLKAAKTICSPLTLWPKYNPEASPAAEIQSTGEPCGLNAIPRQALGQNEIHRRALHTWEPLL